MKTILSKALTGTCLAGLALATACHKSTTAENQYALAQQNGAALPALPASVPMQPGPATALTPAPSVTQLPAAPRLQVRQLADSSADYAYLDRAASYDDTFFDAPPDYAFDYDGVRPWGWQAADGSTAYAEPVDGGYRYYYYEPGSDTPYLVRDRDYSYGYDGPSLVVIYDREGRVVPPNAYGPRVDYAGRYMARGRALRGAGQANHQGIVAANWAARRPQIVAASASLDAARQHDPAWSAYHDRMRDQQAAHWQAERQARAAAAQQFASYQHRGFQGPPPNFAQPNRGPNLGAAQQRQQQMAAQQNHQQAAQARMIQQQQVQARQQQAAVQQQQLAAQHQQQQAAALHQQQAQQQQLAAQHQQQIAAQHQQQAAAQRQMQTQHRQQIAAQRQQQVRHQQQAAAQHQQQVIHQQQAAAQHQQQVLHQQQADAQHQQQVQRQQQMAVQHQQQAAAQHQQQAEHARQAAEHHHPG